VNLFDKVLKHGLGHVEVSDDAVFQWPDRSDVTWRAAQHPLGFNTNRGD